MSDYLIKEERLLLNLLKDTLNNGEIITDIPEVDWSIFFKLADNHAVLSLLYDCLQNAEIPESLMNVLKTKSVTTVQQSYRLAFLTKALVELFDNNDIFCVALKGVCASVSYPIPELRKSGDIDLLIEPDCLQKATELLINEGYIKNETQHANHHISFTSKEGIEVEMHTMLTEPFDNNEINDYLNRLVNECKLHWSIKEVMGIKIKTLEDGYFAYQLLLHMLQHFLRAGFGLKLLCDWVVFWNNEVSGSAKADYLRLVVESGLKGFSDIITALCIYEFGLKEENVSFMFIKESIPKKNIACEFLKEILEAEEFGRSANDRMVVMRGTGLFDYIREFHHQMQLNYPRYSKNIIIWPVLWMCTFVNFIINNKKVRNVSTLDVLKKARLRSRIMEQMHLFK